MVFTHSGRVGDFFTTLPIYSAWYKKYNDKVTIVVPNNFPFVETTKEFTKRFEFIEDFVVSDFNVWHFDCGGVPYKFNPNDYGVNCDRWINLGFRSYPTKFVADFCAEEYPGLEVDYDFSIEIPFDQEYSDKYSGKIGFSNASAHRDDYGLLEELVVKSGVDYHRFSHDVSLWENLMIAKHCSYNIAAGSAMAILMSFAKIPFSVFTWQTPPMTFYRPSPNIFSIWQPPSEILKFEKRDLIKSLNLSNFVSP